MAGGIESGRRNASQKKKAELGGAEVQSRGT